VFIPELPSLYTCFTEFVLSPVYLYMSVVLAGKEVFSVYSSTKEPRRTLLSSADTFVSASLVNRLASLVVECVCVSLSNQSVCP